MAADDLIVRIKERANDPRLQNSMRVGMPADAEWAHSGGSNLCPPTDIESVREAQRRIGFRFPALLERIYVEVGNGGFGPGYGLFGVTGGYADDLQDLTLPELYLSQAEYHWPEGLVPICDWGCTMGSAIDCSSLEGEMVFIGDGSPLFMPEGITFAGWLEDWVNGVDLFERVYRRYQKADRPTLRPPLDV